MSENETAGFRCNGTPARENPTSTPQSMGEGNPRRKFTRRRRGPYPNRSFRVLVRHGLLETFVNIGSRP